MSRYPRAVRASKVKCIACNAPAAEVDSGEYVCVECGERPIRRHRPDRVVVERDGIRVEKRVRENGRYASDVQFEIESRCELPVAVRLTEPVHETIRDDMVLNGAPDQAEWTPTPMGLEFSGILEPGRAVETGYSVAAPRGNPHLVDIEPTLDAVNLVDQAAVDGETVPNWRGGSSTATDGGALANGASQQTEVHQSPGAVEASSAQTGTGVSFTAERPTAGSDGAEGYRKLPQPSQAQTTAIRQSTYLLPPGSAETPAISVVLPTMNEERGIGQCIEAVISALETLELPGEVVVSDSSTDRTPKIARLYGAKVVTPDREGYGAAYQYGFEHARGDYIVMGDADTTYDFEELPKLFERVASGDADMAMGSRFAGEIKPGAMPWLHRRIGNPVLTKFLNAFYDADVSDAHSGFRVLTREALEELELRSDGMEFASEMVMAAGERGLTIAEEPITYHPRVGEAKLDSLSDGWRHVKFMLTNTPTHVFSLPAVGLTVLGLVTMLLALFDAQVFGLAFATHAVIAGSLLTIIGYQVASLAVFSAVAGTAIKQQTDPITTFVRDRFKLEHGATIGLGMYAVGAAYVAAMVVRWVSSGYTSLPFVAWNMVAFTFIVLGVQTVFYSFFLSQLGQRATDADGQGRASARHSIE